MLGWAVLGAVGVNLVPALSLLDARTPPVVTENVSRHERVSSAAAGLPMAGWQPRAAGDRLAVGSHCCRVTHGRVAATGSSHGQVPVTLEDRCFFQLSSERLGGLPGQ